METHARRDCKRPRQVTFFRRREEDFADWNFKLKAFTGNLNQRALSGMVEVERGQEQLMDTYSGE